MILSTSIKKLKKDKKLDNEDHKNQAFISLEREEEKWVLGDVC